MHGHDIDLSIIILTYNVQDYLRQCIKSIFAHPPHCSFEVIVVDNASSDGSVEMVRDEFPQVRLIANSEDVGLARGYNIGFENARGELIFLLNPGALVLSGTLNTLIAFMRDHPSAGVIGPWIRDPDFTNNLDAWNNYFRRVRTPNLFAVLFLSPKSYPLNPVQVDWILNAASLFRRRDIDWSPLFDETFFIDGEEIALCWRMRQKGLSCFLIPQAQIIRYVGRSYAKNVQHAIRFHREGHAGVFFRRAQMYGALWARLDCVVAFIDHMLLSVGLSCIELFKSSPQRRAVIKIYVSLIKVNLRLLVWGTKEALQIDKDFRQWISSSERSQ